MSFFVFYLPFFNIINSFLFVIFIIFLVNFFFVFCNFIFVFLIILLPIFFLILFRNAIPYRWSRLPYVLGTRFSPAINLCSLSPDCLRRLLTRSDCPWRGVAPLRPRRQSGATRLFRSWHWSLPVKRIVAYPSARLLQESSLSDKGIQFSRSVHRIRD